MRRLEDTPPGLDVVGYKQNDCPEFEGNGPKL